LETDAARVRVAVALGSNLGDREAHLTTAASRLASLVAGLQLSPFFDTAPVGVPPQPRFLNAAVVGWTTLSARALLDGLLAIEAAHGRERPRIGSPRTLDLDLIVYGDAVIDEPGLEVPHPRFRGRRFVLEPLAAIAPDLEDPVTGKRVSELLAELPP
jgi:2-amino-4-hydroxy-6-hydroxymethyldihydropteridine diphosphokinase